MRMNVYDVCERLVDFGKEVLDKSKTTDDGELVVNVGFVMRFVTDLTSDIVNDASGNSAEVNKN